MPRFDEVHDDALHLVRYQPHRNCNRVAQFCGQDTIGDTTGVDTDSPCDTSDNTTPWVLDNGTTCPPGDWISRLPDGTYEIVPNNELVAYITGTTGTHLET